MKQTDSVIEGLRRLLYGSWRPTTLADQYEDTDEELFEALWTLPDNPSDYLQSSEELTLRWGHHFTELPRQWMPAFRKLPASQPEPFHPLCKFYRSVIVCEMRLIISLTKRWVEQLELSLLKYELLTLQQGLISLLSECDRRQHTLPDREGQQVVQLEEYMAYLLGHQLVMLLQELGDRYGHLLNERTVSLEKLYLKWLHRPVPSQHPWYHTEAYYDFFLEKYLRGTGRVEDVKALLRIAHAEQEQWNTPAASEQIKGIINRLYNVLLCYVAGVETDQMKAHDLLDARENSRRITDWIAILNDEKKRNESFRLDHLIRRVGYLNRTIGTDETFEAGRLLLLVRHIFHQNTEPGADSSDASIVSEAEAGNVYTGHWALQEYISMDTIQEKLSVHPKTLNKYLEHSEASVIVFSQKNKWMHEDDFHEFMQNHIENS